MSVLEIILMYTPLWILAIYIFTDTFFTTSKISTLSDRDELLSMLEEGDGEVNDELQEAVDNHNDLTDKVYG